MAKRSIRLKEYQPNTDNWYVPAREYLAQTDGTLSDGPFRCRSDRNGFIETGNAVPLDSTSVVFLGGSFVESIYSTEGERFISAAERMMNTSGHAVRLLNGGYSGSTTLQLLNVLINKIYPLLGPGGKVVFFGPHSDRDYLYKQGSYWSNTQRGATILPPGDVGHPDIPRGIKSAEMTLRLVVSTAKQLGLNLTLATSPYRTGEYSSDPIFALKYHGRQDWHRSGMLKRGHFISMIHDVALDTGTPLIDIHSIVYGESQFFYDELHLSPAGQHLVAGHIANVLPAVLDSFKA